jgi:APA family basic amino acid/polyamine antiporter
VACALAGYVDRTFVPLSAPARLILAAGVIVALAEINVRGVVPGKRTNNSLMALKLAGIATLALLAAIFGRGAATSFGAPALGTVTLTAFLAALVPVIFAYGGWQSGGSMAAEMRDPARTLARANVLGVALVVVVYVGLVLIYLWVLPPAEVASSTALAADVAQRLTGDAGSRFVGALITVSCLGFIAVMTMTGPRLYYAMAADGLFVERAARLHPRFGTPHFTIRAQAAVALLLLLTQTYDQLLSYVVFCDALFFALTALALFRLRRRNVGGEAAEIFRAPGHPWTTALFALANAGIVLNCFAAAPRQAALGCGVLAVGAAAYFTTRSRRTARA